MAFVVTVSNGLAIRPEDLVRPTLVAVVAALAIQLGFTAMARDRYLGALLALPVLLGLSGLGPIAPVVIGVILIVALVGLTRHIPLRGLPWARITRYLDAVAMLVLTVVIAQAFANGLVRLPAAPDQPAAAPDAPDIYVVLLDGYPRADTLAVDFGIDNGPFLSELRGRGFEIEDQAHSNYNDTALTLASMLNAAQLKRVIPDVPAGADAQTRLISEAIRSGTALEWLRSEGYEIVTVPSSFTWLMPDADRSVRAGTVTDLELSLLWASGLRAVLPDQIGEMALESHRAGVEANLRAIASIAAEEAPRPRFVLDHILAPHPPYVLGGGEPWPCYPSQCTLWDPGYRYGTTEIGRHLRPQLDALNQMVLATVDAIVEHDLRPAVVVLMSDHGHRFDPDDLDEMLRSFLAVRTPDRSGLFDQDPTPINIIPRILNAYFDVGLPLATDESYVVDLREVDVAPLGYRPWPVPGPAVASQGPRP